MNERRPRSGRMVGIAENVAAAVRRRQREREPRVALYHEATEPVVIAPSAPGYDELLDAADAMFDLVEIPRRPAPPRGSGEGEEPQP